MKKAAFILLFLFSGLTIYFLTLHRDREPENGAPAPSRDRIPVQKSDSEPSDATRTPPFRAPWYEHTSDRKPTWILRGQQGTVKQSTNVVVVQEPVVDYFPRNENEREVRKVRIRGNRGRKKSDAHVVVQGNVRVNTDAGHRLTTERLHTLYRKRELYTGPEDPVHLEHGNLRVQGNGFHGRTELDRYRLKNAVRLKIDREQRSDAESGEHRKTEPADPTYYITGGGPFRMKRLRDGSEGVTWRAEIQNDAFLYRARPSGTLRVRSGRMTVWLVEHRSNSSDDSDEQSPKEPDRVGRRMTLKKIRARNHVVARSPRYSVHTDRLVLDRRSGAEKLTFRGTDQEIWFPTGEGKSHVPGGKKEEKTGSIRREKKGTTVRFSGPGSVVQKPAPPSQGSEKSRTNLHTATFQNDVRLTRSNTDLSADRVTIQFRVNEDNRNSEKHRGKPDVRTIHAEKNVLYAGSRIAASGDVLDWSIDSGQVRLTGTPNARVSDFVRRLSGQTIRVDRSAKQVHATGGAETVVTVRDRQIFAGMFSERSVPGRPEPDHDRWKVTADNITIAQTPGASRLKQFRASGDVALNGPDAEGKGDTFLLDHRSDTAVLSGEKQEAMMKQNRNRFRAKIIRYRLDAQVAHLIHPKRVRLVYREESDTSREKTNSRDRLMHIYTRDPVVLNRRSGTVSLLGRSHLIQPSSRMRGDRMRIRYDREKKDVLRAVLAKGNVFLDDRRGRARGDLIRWNVVADTLEVRGQPSAFVHYEGRRAKYEIVTISENWTRFRGENRKWDRAGKVWKRNNGEDENDE